MKDFAPRTLATKAAEPATGKGATLVDNRASTVTQRKTQEAIAANPRQVAPRQQAPMQLAAPRPNRTGLPDKLKAGVESLSGHSLDDVKVHYNSAKPAQLQAHAYAQGTNIHLGPGQEKYLPHEAWHVVQQKQGRVRATMQLKGISVNNNKGLEKEADAKGMMAKELSSISLNPTKGSSSKLSANTIYQLQDIVQFGGKNGEEEVEPAKKKRKYEPTNNRTTAVTAAVASSVDSDADTAAAPAAAAKKTLRRPILVNKVALRPTKGAASSADSDVESDSEILPIHSSASLPAAAASRQLRSQSTARISSARWSASASSAESDMMSADDTKKRKRASSTVTLSSMDETLKAARESSGWKQATGHSGSGKWTGEVTVRGKKSFDGQRVWQVMRHISTVIYHYVKSKVTTEQEVQAMLVGERLYVSSNSAESMLSLGELDSVGLFDMFLNEKYISKSDKRAFGDIQKLKKLIKGTRIDDINVSDGEKMQLETISNIVKSAIKNPKKGIIVKTLSGDIFKGSKNQIVAIPGLDGIHAEQNLIIAYYKSGISEPALIYGKKRPCTGCYLTFKFATEVLGLKITYNVNPGGAWGPAEKGLVKLMQERNTPLSEVQEFVDKHLPEMTHRTAIAGKKGDITKSCHDIKKQETGYDTASDSGSDCSELEIDINKYVSSSGKPAAASKEK